MRHYLARANRRGRQGWLKRFDPLHWTVDFPRPMMAAATVPSAGTLRVDLDFLTGHDLAGLIWASEDRASHPLLARETARDYSGVLLTFDWVAGPGLMPLDALFGAVLTVEGRDAAGVPGTWYVRLWNSAVGTGLAASVSLDFDDLRAGFQAGGPLVPVTDIDRLFLSFVPAVHDGTPGALEPPVSTWIELRNMRATGPGSTIAVGDAWLTEHAVRMASGYDDSYHQPPERLVEQWRALGYRGLVNHYVGMSHYPALRPVGGGRFEVAAGLCGAATAWHRALARAARDAGYDLIWSLSFELFDAHAPADWAQRSLAGDRALTGWEPPSTLLSPCHADAMAWLQDVAAAFVALAVAEGLPVLFQVGEPWWWVGPDGAPCFFDAATRARHLVDRGMEPPAMVDVAGERTTAELAFLDWLGMQLAAATDALVAAARAAAGGTLMSHLLFYAPQVLDSARPALRRANMPPGWAFPAYDVLQLEDYSFVIAGDAGGLARGAEAVSEALGYPAARQHYMAGFVLAAADAERLWSRIAEALAAGALRGLAELLVWAWPQVARDGFVLVDVAGGRPEEEPVEAFHDVAFPLALGFEASGGPEFLTQIALMASGFEQRNAHWAQARLRYDAGGGVRSDSDLRTLLAFFRARRGQAHAFRFRDPLDWTSAVDGGVPGPGDQWLGDGDGLGLRFELVKRYDAGEVRRITRPVADTLRVAVDGVEQADGWTLAPLGELRFAEAPAAGARVTAGFAFDVPVRFAVDRLDISLAAWAAGEAPSVPLVEVRE